jgi:hypothetical protein
MNIGKLIGSSLSFFLPLLLFALLPLVQGKN